MSLSETLGIDRIYQFERLMAPKPGANVTSARLKHNHEMWNGRSLTRHQCQPCQVDYHIHILSDLTVEIKTNKPEFTSWPWPLRDTSYRQPLKRGFV